MCGGFWECHASCFLGLIPLVRMIKAGESTICQFNLAFGGPKTEAKNFEGVIQASSYLRRVVVSFASVVCLRRRGGRASSTRR